MEKQGRITYWGLSGVTTVGYIADIAGLISFFISIILLFITESTRQELSNQKSDYKKERIRIRDQIAAVRINILEDNLLNMKTVSEIRENIFTFQQKYSRLVKIKDRRNINKLVKMLDGPLDGIDRGMLCKLLDYFVARFERKEM